nr:MULTISPECIES: DsrE/DsrF/DrsH-like family protein [unclassified Paenibacillus]
MLTVLKIPTRTTIASSFAIVFISAIGGVIGKISTGQIPVIVTVFTVLGSLIGAPLGSKFGWMMPRGPQKLALSKMNFAGLGPQMIKHVMKKHNALSLPQLIELAQEQGIKLVACTMTMDLLGLQQEELMDGLEYAGVAAYLGDASQGKVNLFI